MSAEPGVVLAGDHHRGDGGAAGDVRQKLEPGLAGKADVAQDDGVGVHGEQPPCLVDVGRAVAAIPSEVEDAADQLPHVGIVIDAEDRCGAHGQSIGVGCASRIASVSVTLASPKGR